MFEGTASLWRRLTGKGETTPEITQENRRVWVRHPCDLRTQVEAPGADEPPLDARIVDISRGGAKVILGRAHEPGSLISLELPGADGKTSWAALACVVHQSAAGTDEWLLGVSFSKELEEDHMRAFGVRGVSGEDKRRQVRFTPDVTATVQLTNSGDQTQWPAKVLDLSGGGVALCAGREIANGTLLTVDLRGSHGHSVPSILACVVHIATQDDGSRRLGCNFIRELEENDFQALL